MSVKITVNGKFHKSCERRNILDDPVLVKRQQEEQRRKQRIQEVREESNNLARKIRHDVAAEQDRQLRNLEAMKAKELECWRQHVLGQKNHDYREAIFQVGSAHRAAKAENAARAANQKAKNEQYRNFRKKQRERLSCGLNKNKPAKRDSQPACTQTYKVLMKTCCKNKGTCTCQDTRSSKESRKSKEKDVEVEVVTCSDSTSNSTMDEGYPTPPSHCTCCTCSEESEEEGEECSEGEEEESDKKKEPVKHKRRTICAKLSTKPSVLFEVEVDSNESLSITCNNKKQQEGEQQEEEEDSSPRKSGADTSARESSPRRSTSKQPSSTTTRRSTVTTTAVETSPRRSLSKQPSTSTTRRSTGGNEMRPKTPVKEARLQAGKPTQPQQPPPPAQQPKKSILKPRYTQVSDLVNKKTVPPVQKQVPPAPPPSLRTISPQRSTQKTSGSGKSGLTVTASSATVTLESNPCRESTTTANTGNVDFYDYNNKYTRQYPQPVHTVRVSTRDYNQPNAMEQAAIEKQLQQTRQKEAERMRARSAERGEQALEREQVRRDCMELTQKLDALTKQYPHLMPPNDANMTRPHQVAAQTARREDKLNAAVEDMLIRPVVITCPEVDQQAPRHRNRAGNLNLGAPDANDLSSDSCASILLNYVDDQRQQLRSDLNDCESHPESEQKSVRLKRLLQRVDDLRRALCAELGSENDVRQVIDGVSNVRQERERILSEATEGSSNMSPALRQQRKAIEQKEKQLEHKLRELCKLKNSLSEMGPEESKHTEGKEKGAKNPMEIVIRLKNDTKAKKQSAKGAKKAKTKSKGSKSPEKGSSSDKPLGPQREEQSHVLIGQNSYDSNSTSYRSLPSRINNRHIDMIEHGPLTQSETDKENIPCENEEEDNEVNEKSRRMATVNVDTPSGQVNALVAYYVQRLLRMSRTSVNALGVSTPEIETPTSSIINVSRNMASTPENVAHFEERLVRVNQFINENRSFIEELEQSLRTHSNASMDNSMKRFDEIWQQRLSKTSMRQKGAKDPRTSSSEVSQKKSSTAATNQAKTAKAKQKKTTPPPAQPQPAPRSKRLGFSEEDKQRARTPTPPPKKPKPAARKQDKSVETAQKGSLSAEEQIERYAQLTENCTQRIAELTSLINKVRQEKQRLMEVTLSSVSDGRNSTEYKDLPDDQRGRSGHTSDAQSDDTISPQEEAPMPQSSCEQLSNEQRPLEKGKATGISRDSGISSRPATAQDFDPPSHSSGTSVQHRKSKPPPTLQRYSPQLVEDEIAHELSTIVEVETPLTAHTTRAAIESARQMRVAPQPVQFPTFEQYVRELNLDMTQIDPDTSMLTQQAFDELIANLRALQVEEPNYQEFPSLSVYLQNLTIQGPSDQQVQSPETIDQLLACLRIANLTIKSFPSHHEYMRRMAVGPPELPLIDTASLENISEDATPCTDTESDMNIEQELMRRNILQRSFRTTKERVVNFTTQHEGSQSCSRQSEFTSESGIEKISSSAENGSGELERELLGVGMKWPTAMRQKTKEMERLSGTTSSNSEPICEPCVGAQTPRKQHKGVHTEPIRRSPRQICSGSSDKSASSEMRNQGQSPRRAQNQQAMTSSDCRPCSPCIKNQSSQTTGSQKSPQRSSQSTDECGFLSDFGRPLNLRDFLTKELLKRASQSSSSSTDDSLRSHFLQSIVQSMTPRTTTGGNNIERQKTSTPVTQSGQSYCSGHTSSSSPTQLFSGESRISSVHFQERRRASRNKCPQNEDYQN